MNGIAWQPQPKAAALEFEWGTFPVLAAFFLIMLHMRSPDQVPTGMIGWGLDAVFIVAGAAMAWKARDRLLASAISSTVKLAVSGLGVASIATINPAWDFGPTAYASSLLTGMSAAGLGWLLVQIPYSNWREKLDEY